MNNTTQRLMLRFEQDSDGTIYALLSDETLESAKAKGRCGHLSETMTELCVGYVLKSLSPIRMKAVCFWHTGLPGIELIKRIQEHPNWPLIDGGRLNHPTPTSKEGA